MDPLSIVASAIAIAGAVGTVLQKAQELGAAKVELAALSNEIADLLGVLYSTEQALRNFTQGPLLQQDVHFVQTAHSIRLKLQNIKQQIHHWAGGGVLRKHPLDPRRLNRIHLSFKANRLKDDVRNLRIQLMTFLNSVTATKVSRIQLDLQDIYLLAEDSTMHQIKLEDKAEAYHAEQLYHLQQISSSIPGLRLPEQPSNAPMVVDEPSSIAPVLNSSDGRVTTSATSVRAFHHNGAILFDSKEMTASSAVGIRTANFSRVACKPWCSCVCHNETKFQSPSSLELLVGSLFLGYSGIPRARPKCNEMSCHLEAQPLIYITYFFPTWFLCRMISLVISHTPLAGPVVSLKMNRTVPGDSEIFLCAKNGNIERIKNLFESGLASPHDVSYSSGITALHYALSYQQLDICRLLLWANADPFLEDYSRWTAADNAWGKILSGRFSSDKEQQLRLMFSDTDCLERWNFTRLHKIVLGLSSKDLKAELQESTAEIDVTDSNGRTALSFATERSDLAALSLLLSYGANPAIASAEQGSPLHFAATAFDASTLHVLLKHGAEVDCTTSYLQTPLIYAAAYNSSQENTETLLQAGANPNYKDRDGMTPLHWCAISGNLSAAKSILDHGGGVNDIDNNGDSVLSQSIKANRHEIIALILKHSPRIDNVFANGKNMLHIIAADADLEAMSQLRVLDFSALDPKGTGDDGRTAFDMLRSRNGSKEELETAFNLLLQKPASTPIRGDGGDDELWEDAVEFQ